MSRCAVRRGLHSMRALRQAVSGGASWFRGSARCAELPVAVPGPACTVQTTCALASERSGSTMHRESEPATSSLRYATGRARSAPALHKSAPPDTACRWSDGALREPTSARFLDVIAPRAAIHDGSRGARRS
jgi:hypothetical protein